MTVRAPSAGGFTLIEVLVAFAILSLTLAALYGMFGQSAKRAHLASVQRTALLVASARLTEAETIRPIRLGRQSGEEQGFRWESEVTLVDNAKVAAMQPRQRIAIEVRVLREGPAAVPPIVLRTERLVNADAFAN